MSLQTGVSVVIPTYNGAQLLSPLLARLIPVMEQLRQPFEVIIVNDGSSDTSWDVLSELSHEYAFIRPLDLMRNFGQHNALLAGIRAARYSVVVTMDDDLQHPPEAIPILLDKLGEQYDLVYGIPLRQQHTAWRNVASQITKRIILRLIGVSSSSYLSAFRAFRTPLRQAFANYQSPQVLLDVLLSWGAARTAAVKVRYSDAKRRKSTYNFPRLLRLMMAELTGFSVAPLRFASFVGFAFTAFGILTLIYVLARALLQGSVPGFPTLASLIAIFSGAQLFALGIIGEYVGVIHSRLLERPVYIIREHEDAKPSTFTVGEMTDIDSDAPSQRDPLFVRPDIG
jgi:undecaprenyl-phosphate 4-deoxy-4-formamido-L-arabinose transferase